MNKPALLYCSLVLVSASVLAAAPLDESREVKELFKKPTRDYSNGPLWVWNDMLTDDQIRSTLRDLAKQQVKQVWVHPRPGLMTPYLSPEWFRLWKLALREAERLDMNVWIYDENSYPSGFAGGFVPELMPESRGKGLAARQTDSPPAWSSNIVAVYHLGAKTPENITARLRSGENVPSGKFMVFEEVLDKESPWHGNRTYVNLLSPGVTEKFLEITLEPYRKEIGRHFGKRVPGVFTDEPNIKPAGELPWSEVLAAEFQKRWGYDLLDHLPSLVSQTGDWQKVRHNYYQVLHEQFVKHWAKPYFEYCEKNNLEFTGHYWDHEWPNCTGVPDNMSMYAWHQRPAIDCLMNQYKEGTHAQFGNVRMVKELSSVANQMGSQRTLCEIYGAGGWDLRFEDMKRIGDWLQVLGVNTLNEHLSYVTLRGARKRDHPQSFSYHTPWWPDYHVIAGYFARVSAALSQGEQINRVLVLEPTTTAWMYQREGVKLRDLGDTFVNLLMSLESAQVEYDLGSEDVIAAHGKRDGNRLRVGKRLYDIVVIPPLTENLNSTTARLLEGVTTTKAGASPNRIDGATGTRTEQQQLDAAEQIKSITDELSQRQRSATTYIERTSGDSGILFHNRRELKDGELLFLVNTSIENPSAGTIISKFPGLEEWDSSTGEVRPYAHDRLSAGLAAKFKLPPSGSLLLFLSKKPAGKQPPHQSSTVIVAQGQPEARRIGPNVLTIDYVDVEAGGESKTNIYYYQANQFAWRQNGMPRNPWDSAVQFKDELIRKRFPEGSGFEANYRFNIQGQPPARLDIVIERPDLYEITCNGKPVTAGKEWWLDKAFRRLNISRMVQNGANVVTVKATPFTMFHELEPAYLLGDFSAEPTVNGFVIAAPKPLKLGAEERVLAHSATPDGTMWLSSGIGFRQGNQHDDKAPYLVFDLGKMYPVSEIRIWNYNEGHIRDLSARGVKRLRLSTAGDLSAISEGSAETRKDLGEYELPRAGTSAESFTAIKPRTDPVRFVRLDMLSNHQGAVFPANNEPEDNGFVGLAEVEFMAEGRKISGVRVAKASSELPSHERLARSLVDESGLGWSRPGWNQQGMPFYAEGVSYRQRFEVPEKTGTYAVRLGEWLGSVARVRVNGKDAGRIAAPPWECDVTSHLRKGQNDIEVIVVGTLKNTLGPHHGNPALGAAWPSGFHRGPETGPPPGKQYHTVGYGLFEPFVLKHSKAQPLQMSR